jgi:site-specific recombinase XerD
MNKCCKQLAKRINTYKPITMHTARHGFAELARKKKVDLYSISKALGHFSLSITERYLASFDIDTLEETVNTVFGD